MCVFIDVPPGAHAPAKIGFVKAFVASCSVVGCFLHRLHSVSISMRKLNIVYFVHSHTHTLLIDTLMFLYRVSDYKHHASDVVAGFLLGAGIAYLTVSFLFTLRPLCRAS